MAASPLPEESFDKLKIEKDSPQPMAASTNSVTELEILLVGKTGTGKSSSGNTILGQDVFVTSDSGESATSETVVRFGKRDKYIIKIVDTPGVLDTKFTREPKKMVEYAVDKLSESFYHCPSGFHALVLVLRYPSRMTAEETGAVNQLRKIFGEDFIKNHCVLIVTGGENFDLEKKKRNYESFEKWCEVQTGTFGYLVGECKNRVVLFYNLSGDDKKMDKVEKFFSIVAKIGKKYTNDEFNKWKKSRDILIVRFGLVQVKENLEPKIDIVVNKFNEIKSSTEYSTEDMQEKMKMLKAEIQDLKREIEKEDRETGVLLSLKKTVMNLELAIDGTLEAINKEHRNGIPLSVLKETNKAMQMLFNYMEQLARIQEQGRVELEKSRQEMAAERDRSNRALLDNLEKSNQSLAKRVDKQESETSIGNKNQKQESESGSCVIS